MDGNEAGLDGGDAIAVDIDAGDGMTECGEADGGGEADVAEADHGDGDGRGVAGGWLLAHSSFAAASRMASA